MDSLYSLINSSIYQDSAAANSIDLFIQNNLIPTINNDTIAYYYFYTLSNLDYLGFVHQHVQIVHEPGIGGAINKCKCKDMQLAIKDCLPIDKCLEGNCAQTSWGCGVLYLQGCTGLCLKS